MTFDDGRWDRWKDGYDAWKLEPPPEYDGNEVCYHEDRELDWQGYARCPCCGVTWWASDAEIAAERRLSADYDAMMRREERRERWRERWAAWVLVPTLPLRMWLQGVVWRAFPKRRRINRFISSHDDIPF